MWPKSCLMSRFKVHISLFPVVWSPVFPVTEIKVATIIHGPVIMFLMGEKKHSREVAVAFLPGRQKYDQD